MIKATRPRRKGLPIFETTIVFEATIAGSLPKPDWLAEPMPCDIAYAKLTARGRRADLGRRKFS